MKSLKKSLFVLVLLLVLVLSNGCIKRDSLEDIEIVTTVYPLEYITNRLYGEHSIVYSIYPDGTSIDTYTLSDKQLKDYSKKELFVYNLKSDDKYIATSFLERHKDMLIIDSSFGMNISYGIEELWLNPSHLLMMAQNVRDGLQEYITNSYLKKDIDAKYEEIKLDLSELDAELKLVAQNAVNKQIVVSNNVLQYLQKYGLEVYSLDYDNPTLQKTIQDVRNLANAGTVNYFFQLEGDTLTDEIKKLIEEENLTIITYRKIDNITEVERDNKEDYLTLMYDNIESLKEELYK